MDAEIPSEKANNDNRASAMIITLNKMNNKSPKNKIEVEIVDS